ncbi:hypothetical protein Agub_g7353, partial [Astrephomene gubernaculifera]
GGAVPSGTAPGALVPGGGTAGVGGPVGSGLSSGVPYINYEASVLTKLLSDALGGNALCLLAGTLRQADGGGGLQAINTLQYLTIARAARNFPIINHGRARGLMQKLRHRLMAVVEDRQALRELLDSTPAEGDPNSMALNIAKLRDMEARLMAVRAENAELVEEKQALQARMQKLYQSEEGDLEDKKELQEALIQSEEQRLQLSRALIDFQMEFNEAKQEWETAKHDLEVQLIEADARRMESDLTCEEVAVLQQQREELAGKVEELEQQLQKATEEAEQLRSEVARLGSEVEALTGGASVQEVLDRRRKDAEELKDKDRRLAELQGELAGVRREADAARSGALLNQTAVDEVREAYRRRLAVLSRDVADMGRAVAILEADPQSELRVGPEELYGSLQQLAEENVKVSEAREADVRADADDLAARHLELKRKFKALYGAYRSLRYMLEDRWPAPEEPPKVPTEDQVVGAALEGIIRSDEEADHRTINKLRDKIAQLEAQQETLRVARAAGEAG